MFFSTKYYGDYMHVRKTRLDGQINLLNRNFSRSVISVLCEIRVKTLISKQSQREGMRRGRTEWNKNDELTYDEFFMKNYQ